MVGPLLIGDNLPRPQKLFTSFLFCSPDVVWYVWVCMHRFHFIFFFSWQAKRRIPWRSVACVCVYVSTWYSLYVNNNNTTTCWVGTPQSQPDRDRLFHDSEGIWLAIIDCKEKRRKSGSKTGEDFSLNRRSDPVATTLTRKRLVARTMKEKMAKVTIRWLRGGYEAEREGKKKDTRWIG